MFNSLKLLSSLAMLLSLSACASLGTASNAPAEIRYAPAIDTSYREVSENIKESIGVNVRWGGEIIDSKRVGELTELTVFAHPLSKDGRPAPWSDKEFSNDRFIVAVKEQKETLLRKYVTVYGQVSGEKELVNGPRSITVPIITAIESKEWNPKVSNDRRGVAYYNLGHSTGHFRSFGHRNSFGRFSKFGHRGFSRFGNRGFGKFGHRFRSGNRFGRRGFFSRGRFH